MSATILAVEDDLDLLFLYQTALAQQGLTVVTAATYAEMVEHLENPDTPPDIVLLDMEIPDMPGTRAVQYLRGSERFSQTPIIVLTANEDYRDRVGEQVDHFLLKPVSISFLTDLVNELLQQAGSRGATE